MTYNIHERNLDQLKTQVAKLARRAAKLKLPPITLAVGEHTNVANPNNPNELTRVYAVEVTGDAPIIGGWSFIASILHDDDGNVVRKCRGQDLPYDPYALKSNCDHCKTNRYRSSTFLLRHEDGRFTQVGSTCLRDFLGHTSPHDLASWAEQVLNLDDLCDAAQNIQWLGGGNVGSMGRSLRMSLPVFLNHVADCALRLGFKGRKDVANTDGRTTALAAFDIMFPSQVGKPGATEFIPAPPEPSSEAVALAEEARNWVLRRFRDEGDMIETGDYDDFKLEAFHSPDAGMSEFQLSLLNVARHEVITRYGIGLASWIVGSYLRQKERRAAAAEAAAKSAHIGKVGDRLRKLKLTLFFQHSWESAFGWMTLYKFMDATGNQFTWKTSSGTASLSTGTTYEVTGTIKAHTDYDKIPQTQLTRCKINELTVATPATL